MKTNGDVFKEKVREMNDKQLYNNFTSNELQRVIGKLKYVDMPFSEWLSQPYEEPKRWYLHRYSTSRKQEIYYYKEGEFGIAKMSFEEACRVRTQLNKNRENKKNLWLLGEVKDE